MNVFIKHDGMGFVTSTVVEYATPITSAEADRIGNEIAEFFDGTMREELRDALREAEEWRKEVGKTKTHFLHVMAAMKAEHEQEIADLKAKYQTQPARAVRQ